MYKKINSFSMKHMDLPCIGKDVMPDKFAIFDRTTNSSEMSNLVKVLMSPMLTKDSKLNVTNLNDNDEESIENVTQERLNLDHQYNDQEIENLMLPLVDFIPPTVDRLDTYGLYLQKSKTARGFAKWEILLNVSFFNEDMKLYSGIATKNKFCKIEKHNYEGAIDVLLKVDLSFESLFVKENRKEIIDALDGIIRLCMIYLFAFKTISSSTISRFNGSHNCFTRDMQTLIVSLMDITDILNGAKNEKFFPISLKR